MPPVLLNLKRHVTQLTIVLTLSQRFNYNHVADTNYTTLSIDLFLCKVKGIIIIFCVCVFAATKD